MATYAVGDIQGCLDPLMCLLDRARFKPEKDCLWFVGDIVNRGPQSLDALRFAFNLGSSARVVLGNHDLHLLAVAYGLRAQSRGDTLDDILTASDRDQLIAWLRQQKLVYHDPELGYTMVHAGIPPKWSLKKALKRSKEVEEALQDDRQVKHYLSTMYGNLPDTWQKGLKSDERLRLITNYFTRMRFCSTEGHLELLSKSKPDQAPEGFLPWFAVSNRKTANEKLIFGHWAALEGLAVTDNIYALDTGCVWGGKLTMMRLEDETRFSCDCG